MGVHDGSTASIAGVDVVYSERGMRQSRHAHFPLEILVGLDGPVTLRSDEGEISADCILVPPMRHHAILDYRGRIASVHLDAGHALRKSSACSRIGALSRDREEIIAFLESLVSSDRTYGDGSRVGERIAAWADIDALAPSRDPRVSAILQHIEEQAVDVAFGRKSAASLVGLSPGRLATLFLRDAGMPLRRYLNWQRARIGARLVCAGENATQAAAQAGFADSAHFSRSCRAAYGNPPSDFTDFRMMRI